MDTLDELYRQRVIKFLYIWEHADWKFKTYYISAKPQKSLPENFKLATFKAIDSMIKGIEPTIEHYHTGFIGINEGRHCLFVYIDWWADKKELHHHGFFSESCDQIDLHPTVQTDAIGCIWDLKLIAFETDAWARHMIVPPHSISKYLAENLNVY